MIPMDICHDIGGNINIISLNNSDYVIVNLKKSFKVIVEPEKTEQYKPDKQMYYRGGAWIPVEPIYNIQVYFLFFRKKYTWSPRYWNTSIGQY